MSIGSEVNGGVSNVSVYDLSIDGTGSGLGGGSSNGIRIKSDASRGGRVSNMHVRRRVRARVGKPHHLEPTLYDRDPAR